MRNMRGSFPDYSGWSVEQIDAYERALGGIMQGDLTDLAAYLRAGYPIGGSLAERLADAIEGRGRIKIDVRATRPGVPLSQHDYGRHADLLRIGAELHALLELAPRAHAAAVKHRYAEEQAYSANKVKEALTYFRKQRAGERARGPWDKLGAKWELEKARNKMAED